MKVEMIMFPYVFTSTGDRINLGDIYSQPSVGDVLVESGNGYEVVKVGESSECVSGVCPIK
jgi:hypothetical protein